MTTAETTPTDVLTVDDMTAEKGAEHAENLFRVGAVTIEAEVARRLADAAPITRHFWIAYADRLDELAPHSPHVADLEACYFRAMRAMTEVQQLRDRLNATPGPGPRAWILVDLDRIIAAFAGEQSR